MQPREVVRVIPARAASDGAGVKISRVVPRDGMQGLDPFLMLDEIRGDGGAGFPPHPHRGFETVTYMRRGAFRHEDHMGNQGRVAAGGAQWMTAGRGVIHSEMPEPDDGWLHGFQLWLNLPAKEKMKAPAYLDMQASDNPLVALDNGGSLRVIAGDFSYGTEHARPRLPVRSTDPYYYDVTLPPGGSSAMPLPSGYRVYVYVYQGAIVIAGETVAEKNLAQLSEVGALRIDSEPGAGFLVLAGKPIGEPVVQHGPFVMNTQTEIERALQDYGSGKLTH